MSDRRERETKETIKKRMETVGGGKEEEEGCRIKEEW